MPNAIKSPKNCGYFGCHVHPDSNCACNNCCLLTGGCQDCESPSAQARKKAATAITMLKFCKICQDPNKWNEPLSKIDFAIDNDQQ